MNDVLNGNLIVPVAIFWIVLWKPSPSRWVLAIRLLMILVVVERLGVHDAFGLNGPVRFVMCAFSMAAGAALVRQSLRYYQLVPVSQIPTDSNLSGSPQ